MIVSIPDVLDALPGAAFALTPGAHGDPVFTLCNPAWFALLNTSPEQAYGRTIAEIVPGPAGHGALAFHRKALNANEVISYSISVPLGRSFGKLRSTLKPMRDAEGRLICLLGTTADAAPLQHSQIVEMRFETLAREIDNFTGFLSSKLLTQLRQVSEVASDLIDGFVDLGDGKLQTIEQIEQDAQTAASMVVEVLGRARVTRSVSDTDTFDVSAVLQQEVHSLFHAGIWGITSAEPIVMADREALRAVLRNVLISAGPKDEGSEETLHITAEIDSPGMLAVSLEAAAGTFDYAISNYGIPDAPPSTRAQALDTVVDIIQQRGGEFFVERIEQTDMVHFTIPGYLLDTRAHAQRISVDQGAPTSQEG